MTPKEMADWVDHSVYDAHTLASIIAFLRSLPEPTTDARRLAKAVTGDTYRSPTGARYRTISADDGDEIAVLLLHPPGPTDPTDAEREELAALVEQSWRVGLTIPQCFRAAALLRSGGKS